MDESMCNTETDSKVNTLILTNWEREVGRGKKR